MNKKKKICFLQPVMAHYRQSLFKELLQSETYQTVFIAGSPYLNIKECNSIPSIKLPYSTFSIFKHRFYYLKRVLKILFKEKPDIIISGGIDFHLIHTIVIFIVYRLIKQKPFFWWSHATEGNQGKIGFKIRLALYKKADGVLTYSKKGRELLINNGLLAQKVISVGNALNIEDYGFLNKSGLDEKEQLFSIVFCGRITPEKKLDELIRALARLKESDHINFICYIIGAGNTILFKEMVQELNLKEQVLFMGSQYGKDASQIFEKCHLMVHPAPIGLSLVQALSFGIPVITHKLKDGHGPEVELIKPELTGSFYHPGNIDELHKTIIFWYNKINSNGNSIQEDCIKQVEINKYLPNVVAKIMLNHINNICTL